MRILRSGALLVIGLLLAVGFVPGRASAHVFQSDGTIQAVLHLAPDDKPTTGQPTTYEFLFADTTNKFNLVHCDCRTTVTRGDTLLADQKLIASDEQTGHATVTFPTPAIYTIAVTGKPTAGTDFQPFKVSYQVRVTAGQSNNHTLLFALIGGIGGGAVLLIIGVLFRRKSAAA